MDEEYIIVKKPKYIEMPDPVDSVAPVDPVAPVAPVDSVDTKSVTLASIKEDIELVMLESVNNNETEKITGIQMITASSLSEQQKQLAKFMYDSVKLAIQDFISDNSINNTVKITMIIGQAIKQMENININGKVPTGVDKKAIVIQMCRILIEELTNEPDIIIIYDIIAEHILEVMIDTSKVVNIRIQEMSVCCPNILNLFKRKV